MIFPDAPPSSHCWGSDWEEGTPHVTLVRQDRVARVRSLGNAVAPQVAEWIGRRILAQEVEE